jgi:hypothetical protein
MVDGLTLATLVPLGSILPAAIVTFLIGLATGGLAQRGLDRTLRKIAVQRAVNAAVKAMQAGEPVALPRDVTVTERGRSGQREHIPGMPYRRAG